MMCGEPAKSKGFLAPGAINTVLVTGLAPNTRYFYQYGAPATGFSREASFLSAPTTGPGSSVKLLMVADHGRYAPDNALAFGSATCESMAPPWPCRHARWGQRGRSLPIWP